MRANSLTAVVVALMFSFTISGMVCGQETAAGNDRQAVIDSLRAVLPADIFDALALEREADARARDASNPHNRAGAPLPKPPSAPVLRGTNLRNVPLKRLPAVEVEQLLAEDAADAHLNKAMRFGVGRNLLAEMHDGVWIRLADGWLWLLDVQADGAYALRVHALNMFLPAGATLVAYALNDQPHAVGPFEDAGPFDDGDLWLPTIMGERTRLEIFVPDAAAAADRAAHMAPPDAFPPAGALAAFDRIQHVYRNPLAGFDAPLPADPNAGAIDNVAANEHIIQNQKSGDEGGIAGSGCHNPIACHPEWLELSRAVAGIGTIGHNSLWCTGQLLRTESNDRSPYFLTANHCLSTNFEARSTEVYWDYQIENCGGAVPPLNTVPHSNVCTLLRTGANSDFTLLMIEGVVPNGVAWADWSSIDAADGAEVVCIHHPSGKHKRISFGQKASNPTCGHGPSHIRSNWVDGITEPGSSGSGLFRADTGELIGQLHCGSSGCGNVTNDSYGAFFVTYLQISDLLDEGNDDGFENNDVCSEAPMLAAGTHNGLVLKRNDSDWYRVRVPAGRRVTVRAQFKNAWGDIDLRLFSSCNGPQVDASLTTANSETVEYVNNAAAAKTLRLRAYLFNDVRNTYKLTVTVSNP